MVSEITVETDLGDIGFCHTIHNDIDIRHQNLTPTRRDDIYETTTRPQRDETRFMRPQLVDTIRYIVHIVHIHRYLVDICRYSLNIPSIFPRYPLSLPPSLPQADPNETTTIFGSYCVTPTRSQRYLGHIVWHQRYTNTTICLKTPDIDGVRYWGEKSRPGMPAVVPADSPAGKMGKSSPILKI